MMIEILKSGLYSTRLLRDSGGSSYYIECDQLTRAVVSTSAYYQERWSIDADYCRIREDEPCNTK